MGGLRRRGRALSRRGSRWIDEGREGWDGTEWNGHWVPVELRQGGTLGPREPSSWGKAEGFSKPTPASIRLHCNSFGRNTLERVGRVDTHGPSSPHPGLCTHLHLQRSGGRAAPGLHGSAIGKGRACRGSVSEGRGEGSGRRTVFPGVWKAGSEVEI